MNKLCTAVMTTFMLGLWSLQTFASTSTAGEIHFLDFNGAGIDMALRNQDVGQVAHDPEECGSTFVFRLLSTHSNYEALSGVLLMNYYSKHPISVTVTGCSSDMPVVVQIESTSD